MPTPEPWLVSVLDRNGAAKDFVTPRGLKIERRLNGAATCSFEIDFEDESPPDVQIGSRMVAAYRGSTLVFAGPIVGLTLAGSSAGGRSASIIARDPFAVLERRYLVPPYLDNFTDTNGTLLSAHTADTGETYTLRSGDSDIAKIHSNRLYVDGTDTEFYYDTGVATSLPFRAEFVVHNVGNITSGASAFIGIGWHFDAAMDDGYVCLVQNPDASFEGGDVYLQEEVADTRSSLDVSGPVDDDWVGEAITYRVEQDVGGAIRVYRGGGLVASATDTTRTSGTLVLAFLSNNGYVSTSAGLHMESVRLEPRLEWSSTDAGTIATDLLGIANAQEETHLDAGTIDTSVNRDRTYDRGKNIGEAITQLAEVDEGFYFRVDAALSGAKVGDLEVEYSASGTDQSDVKWAFGDGTFDNLESYSVVRELPTNDVLALGAEVGGSPLTATSTSASSRSSYGLWGKVTSYTDVSEEATLSAHADDEIETAPPAVYSVQPISGPSNDGARVPRLYADFDVGDLCRLTIADGGVDVTDTTVRVLACTLEVSDDGEVERVTGLQLEETS